MTTTTLAPMATGSAGRRGNDVRSDAWTHVELREDGGVAVDVQSRVHSLYGAANHRLIHHLLNVLGVEHACVEVDDKGALPWVLAARLEAAVLRAGVGARGDARPPRTRPPSAPLVRERLRRSRLYLPGSEPKFMVNAALHRPDAIILDLEDSVHPTEKDTARLLVRNALRVVDFRSAERMVRINQLPLGLEDLEAVVPEEPDVVLLPKTDLPDQVRAVAHRIRDICTRRGCREPWLMPILETALGIENAFAIASADECVVALTIGLEDYTADLGVAKTCEGRESLWARSRVVNAARAAGIQAIDSVYGDIDDDDGLRAWALASRAAGFVGMGCVHPRQIRIIHDCFAPSADEIVKAQRIVAAAREAEAHGLAVVSLGSKMIDPPVVLRAQRIVEQAIATGMLMPGGA